jgi:hypothetical protein
LAETVDGLDEAVLVHVDAVVLAQDAHRRVVPRQRQALTGQQLAAEVARHAQRHLRPLRVLLAAARAQRQPGHHQHHSTDGRDSPPEPIHQHRSSSLAATLTSIALPRVPTTPSTRRPLEPIIPADRVRQPRSDRVKASSQDPLKRPKHDSTQKSSTRNRNDPPPEATIRPRHGIRDCSISMHWTKSRHGETPSIPKLAIQARPAPSTRRSKEKRQLTNDINPNGVCNDKRCPPASHPHHTTTTEPRKPAQLDGPAAATGTRGGSDRHASVDRLARRSAHAREQVLVGQARQRFGGRRAHLDPRDRGVEEPVQLPGAVGRAAQPERRSHAVRQPEVATARPCSGRLTAWSSGCQSLP